LVAGSVFKSTPCTTGGDQQQQRRSSSTSVGKRLKKGASLADNALSKEQVLFWHHKHCRHCRR
jgi:hypothetical protein